MNQEPLHPFDRNARKKLQEHEVAPPAYVWKQVEAGISTSKNRRKRGMFLWFLLIPALGLSFVGGWWLGHNRGVRELNFATEVVRPGMNTEHGAAVFLAENQVQANAIPNQNSFGKVVVSQVETNDVSMPLRESRGGTQQESTVQPFRENERSLAGFENKEESNVSVNGFEKSFQAEGGQENLKELAQAERKNKILMLLSDTLEEEETLGAEMPDLARDWEEINREGVKNKKWRTEIGAHVDLMGSLAFSENQSGDYMPLFGSGKGFHEKRLEIWQYGMFANFMYGSDQQAVRIGLRTGLSYQHQRIETSREGIATVPFNMVQAGEQYVFIHSTAGMMRGIWVKTNLSSPESEGPELSSDLSLSDTTQYLRQEFAWVQIPVLGVLSWNPASLPVSLEGAVGLSPGWLVRNEIWAYGRERVEDVGYTAGMERFRLDFNLRLGVRWEIPQTRLGISFHASFMQSVLNLSMAEGVAMRPVNAGGGLGIVWRLN